MRLSSRGVQIPLALGSGAAAAAAFPPFGLWPGLIGFAVMLAVLGASEGASAGRAFVLGWLAGVAYFLVSTWWVAEAFLVDPDNHGWQAPFAVALLSGGLATLWGAAAWAYRALAPEGALRLFVFAGVFSAAEWIRGHFLTGFPWDLPGEAWKAGSAASQAAALVGSYGLTYLTLLVGASPVLLLGPRSRLERRVGLGVVAGFLALVGWGALRLAGAPPADRDLVVRLVQPNIPQTEKWSPEALQSVIERYAALSRRRGAVRPDVVVWPESALPAVMEALVAPGTWTRPLVVGSIAEGQTLLAGVISVDVRDGRTVYHNSLWAARRVGDSLIPLGRYDKHHLVPFGEYTPLDGLAAYVGFKALVHLGDGYEPGPASEPMRLAGLGLVQPLICYESLFPLSFGRAGGRADWIVNVSNDAWFGQTSGPWQHLNLASYRAIEEGAPIMRATPTGVSAVVDAFGRARRVMPLGAEGVIDSRVPGALAAPPLYLWVQDLPFALAVFVSLGAGVAFRRRRTDRR